MSRLQKFKYFYVLSDLMVITIAFFISTYLIAQTLSLNLLDTELFAQLLFLFFGISIIVLYIFGLNQLYRINIIITRDKQFAAVFKSVFYGGLISILFTLLIAPLSWKSIGLIIICFIMSSALLLYLIRVEFLRNIYMKLSNTQFKRNILIIGAGRLGCTLVSRLYKENPQVVNVVGFLDDFKLADTPIIDNIKILGTPDQAGELVIQKNVDEIIIAIDKIDYSRLLEILDRCQEIPVEIKIVSELFNIVSKKLPTEKYAGIPVVDATPRYKDNFNLKTKRLLDIIFSLMGIIILSPLFILIILFIKVTSPGPIFFRQERVGRDGTPFLFYKFRSMKVLNGEDEKRKKLMLQFMKNANKEANDTKIIDESRVTLIGKILRKFSLDELPQLFNVLKGDMSLVGPRPCLPYEFENYDNWQKRRVNVLPGCTGVWQISGRSSVTFNESVILDLYYINNMSPGFDLQIILKTIPVMLFAKGGK